MNLKEALKRYFGYDSFRENQEDVIKSILSGRDTVLIAPTGLGKSICFQLPAILSDGVTIVISPLISLMKDQADGLNKMGIGAAFINSSITCAAEKRAINRKLHEGTIKILYVAPERLNNHIFMTFIKSLKVSILAVDEAHCISQWGHQFRPSYHKINQLRKIFPMVPCMALTATATLTVRDDIIKQLEMKDPVIFQSSFDRTNLYISVVKAFDKHKQLIDIMGQNKHDGSTIIYCISREESERIANTLTESGFYAQAYHAGIKSGERMQIQDDFISGECKTIVATTAFGMGIDKPDVRRVIHADLSKTMENYYQEIGRGGRDGKHTKCIMIWDRRDVSRWEFLIRITTENKEGVVNEDERKRQLDMLKNVVIYCTTDECRRKQILAYFQEDHPGNCRKCDVCL